MLKRLLPVLTFMLSANVSLWADIDVSELYLNNAGFDNSDYYDYRVGDAGNVSQEILPIYGWQKDIGVDYTVTGVYELGTKKTFNTYGNVPSSGYNGSKGGCLALSTGWEESLKFYQNISLPAGSYKLQAPFYNGSNSTNGNSLLAWVPETGSSAISNMSGFPLNAWTVDEVSFSLSSTTTGRVQIGFQGAANGSSNSAKVVVDGVRLILVGDNSQLTETIRKQLTNTISEATDIYGSGSGNESAALKLVLDDAKSIAGNSSSNYASLFNADKLLKRQIEAYKWANSTLSNPIDFTKFIENPSFENKFTGWKQSGLQSQSNTSFAQKGGSYYVEKWVSKGTAVGNAYVSQIIGSDLPFGVYVLKAAAQNIQQDNATSQTGAWLVAANDSIAVTSAKEYVLQFTYIDDEMQIAFKAINASGNWIAADNFRLYYAAATLDDYKKELSSRVDVASALSSERMTANARKQLQAAVGSAKTWIANPDIKTLASVASTLKKASANALPSVAAYKQLASEIEVAKANLQMQLKGADEFAESISLAEAALDDESFSVEEILSAYQNLQSAQLMFRVANASGAAPTVTTDTRVARGATMAFARATFGGSNILERGFCWSTHPNPKITDSRSTLCYSNNGDIYVMQNLQPATAYYIRPYAISKEYAVGYGKAVKICTLPMGSVMWTYNNGGSDEENDRINNAVADAVDIWNNLTSIKGLHISVSYGASTPTADCSYGGSMRVGPNASYQRTGTIQHEMCHAAGVGTTDRWYNSAVYRQNVSSGFWLGERTDQVLCFLENSDDAHLKGDKTHFWPYGVNGANEDDGTRMLYYANALIIQALGEDFLPPVYGAFASPAYTFTQDDDQLYYLIPAGSNFGESIKVLKGNDGGLSIEQKNWQSALADAACAWQIRFNPSTQLYEVKNSVTNQVLKNGNSNAIQMLGSRQNVSNGYFNTKSYWLTFADGTDQPKVLSVSNDGQSVAVSTFDHQNTATQQRWILFPKAELMALTGDYTSVENDESELNDIHVYGGRNELVVETLGKGGWVSVYNVMGVLVDRFYVQNNMRVRRRAKSGFLIVNNHKVVVE